MKQAIVVFLKIALATGLIIWLLRSGKLDFSELAGIWNGWPWLLLGFGISGLVFGMAALRWRLLLRAQGIEYSLHDTFALTLIGLFFSQFMIGTTGGDMVKAYVVAREQPERRSAAIISVLFDRATGLSVLLTVALGAILVNLGVVLADHELTTFALLVVVTFVSVVAVTSAFYSERVRSVSWWRWLHDRLPFAHTISSIERALYAYKHHPRVILVCFGISFALHLSVVLTTICLGIALLGDSLPMRTFFFLIPVAHLAMALPINPPGALGTGEAIYAHLFERVAISQGGLLSLLMRGVNVGWAAVGCLYYLQRKTRVNEAADEVRHAETLQGVEAPSLVVNAEGSTARRAPSSGVSESSSDGVSGKTP